MEPNPRVRLISEIGAVAVALVAALWLLRQPDYEPLIVFLLAAGTLTIRGYERFRNGSLPHLL